MLGWDNTGTGAGVVVSVTRGGVEEGTATALLQQFPMGLIRGVRTTMGDYLNKRYRTGIRHKHQKTYRQVLLARVSNLSKTAGSLRRVLLYLYLQNI